MKVVNKSTVNYPNPQIYIDYRVNTHIKLIITRTPDESNGVNWSIGLLGSLDSGLL